MELSLKPYVWRGRTYKTINALHNAVRREHPGCGLSFEADFMRASVRGADGVRTYVLYRRDLETNEIADRPEAS